MRYVVIPQYEEVGARIVDDLWGIRGSRQRVLTPLAGVADTPTCACLVAAGLIIIDHRRWGAHAPLPDVHHSALFAVELVDHSDSWARRHRPPTA